MELDFSGRRNGVLKGIYYAHIETITQNVLGILIGMFILHLFNIPFNQSLQMQVVFFIVSYVRGYCVRTVFSKLY